MLNHCKKITQNTILLVRHINIRQNDVHHCHLQSWPIFNGIQNGSLPSLFYKKIALISNVTVALCHLNKAFNHPLGKGISFTIVGFICHHLTQIFCCKFYNMVLLNKFDWHSNNLLKLLFCLLRFNTITSILLLTMIPGRGQESEFKITCFLSQAREQIFHRTLFSSKIKAFRHQGT